MRFRGVLVAATCSLLAAGPASADQTVTFDDLQSGTVVAEQYKGRGVLFGPRAPGHPTGTSPLPVVTATSTGARFGKVTANCPKETGCTGTNEVWGYLWQGRQSRLSFIAAHFGSATATFTLTAYDVQGRLLTTVTRSMASGGAFNKTPFSLSVAGMRYFRLKSSTLDPIGIDALSHEGLVEPSGIAIRITGGDSVMFRGETGFVDVAIDRTNHLDPVIVTAVDLPAGVTPSPVSTTLNTARVTLSASATASTTTGSTFRVRADPGPTFSQFVTATAPIVVKAFYDARIIGMELTQGIQTESTPWADTATPDLKTYRGVSLQANGHTLLRVYVNNRLAGDVPGVMVRVHATDPATGAALPGSPITSAPNTISSSSAAVAGFTQRMGGAITVTLPWQWTGNGGGQRDTSRINLRAELVLPASSSLAQCSGCTGNDTQRLHDVAFRGTCCTQLTLVRLIYRRGDDEAGDGPYPYPDPPADSTSIFRMLRPAFNLSPREFRGQSSYATTVDISDIVRSEFALLESGVRDPGCFGPGVANSDISSTPKCFGARAGLRMQNEVDRLGIARNFLIGVWSNTFGVIGQGTDNYIYVGENLQVPMSMAHEFHHGLGRDHLGTRCKDGANNVSWPPDEVGLIQGIGLDRTTLGSPFRTPDGISVTPDEKFVLPDPRAVIDFMSYCTGAREWISVRGWNQLITTATTSAAAGRAAPVATAAQASGGLKLVVTAMADAAGRVEIDSVGPGAGLSRGVAPASPYQLVVRDTAGAVLASMPMGALGSHSHQGFAVAGPLRAAAAVPLDRAAKVEIVRDDAVVASRSRSARAPVGSFTSPRRGARVGGDRALDIRWRATDPDGDRISVTVEWSAQGGAKGTWRTVFAGPNGGRVKLPADYFAGTARGVLRLRINDGFRETLVLSPQFQTVHRRPGVRITGPPGGSVRTGEPLSLVVAAFDERGNVIKGRNITWFDGRRRVARGEHLTVRDPLTGTHRLRVVARDAGGRTTTARTTVRVRAAAPAFVGLSVPARTSTRAGVLRVRLGATVPARLRISGAGVRSHTVRVGRAVKTVRVRVRKGTGFLRLQLALTAHGMTTRTTQIVERR